MDNARRRVWQIAAHAGSWVPLGVLAFDYYAGNLSVNPIQDAVQRTGNIALVLLLLSLACTPAYTLFRFPPALKLRRPLGLYGYLYAAIHLLLIAGLDYGFDLGLIFETIAEKPFILIGMNAFVLLSLLALTSYRWWMVRLGKAWKRLHSLVYIANVLVVLHFGMAVKGDLFRLQGDIFRPLLAGGAVLVLLALRLPAIRRRTAAIFARVKRSTSQQETTGRFTTD